LGDYFRFCKNHQEIKWREFRIGDLFEKKTIKGCPKSKENLQQNPNGYFMYGQNIKRQYEHTILLDDIYLQVIDSNYPILAYASSVGEIGMIQESFYRSGDNGAFQGLFPKFKFTKLHILFILSILKKEFVNFGYSTGMANIINLNFYLPTDSSGQINFDFMESFIKAIEKLTIKNVVLYNEKKLNAYKSIVNA